MLLCGSIAVYGLKLRTGGFLGGAVPRKFPGRLMEVRVLLKNVGELWEYTTECWFCSGTGKRSSLLTVVWVSFLDAEAVVPLVVGSSIFTML